MDAGLELPEKSSCVSVLFSEPKIPQSMCVLRDALDGPCVSVLFSEPKIPQFMSNAGWTHVVVSRFSALQRAENSSIGGVENRLDYADRQFQCSSASRKFLNARNLQRLACAPKFQCSSASRKFLNQDRCPRPSTARLVSVLFSEPKIPQYCC